MKQTIWQWILTDERGVQVEGPNGWKGFNGEEHAELWAKALKLKEYVIELCRVEVTVTG